MRAGTVWTATAVQTAIARTNVRGHGSLRGEPVATITLAPTSLTQWHLLDKLTRPSLTCSVFRRGRTRIRNLRDCCYGQIVAVECALVRRVCSLSQHVFTTDT